VQVSKNNSHACAVQASFDTYAGGGFGALGLLAALPGLATVDVWSGMGGWQPV